MSLRDRIKHVIDCVEDQDDSVCMDAAADAILALVRGHLTSDEAVERAHSADVAEVREFSPTKQLHRAAILAALGDTHD